MSLESSWELLLGSLAGSTVAPWLAERQWVTASDALKVKTAVHTGSTCGKHSNYLSSQDVPALSQPNFRGNIQLQLKMWKCRRFTLSPWWEPESCSRHIFRCRTFISVCGHPPRSTQPGHPLVGRCNEYQPKGGDALWLGSKGRYGSCVGVWSLRYTWPISQYQSALAVVLTIISCYTNNQITVIYYMKYL